MHLTPIRLVLFATALAAAPLTAHAGPKQQAKAHIAKATKAHQDGKFDVALAELQAAYKLDPQSDLLFAIAQVYVKLDRCAEAMPYYEQFLAATKDPQARPVVTEAMDACKAALLAAQPPEPKPEPPVAEPTRPPEPAPAEPPPPASPPPVARPEEAPPGLSRPPGEPTTTRPRRDWIADTLVVGGVVAGVVSIVMYSKAGSDLDAAESSPTLAGYHNLVDSGHAKRTYAIGFGAAGVALAGAGIVHYLLRDHGKPAHGLGVLPARGGGLVTWMGGF